MTDDIIPANSIEKLYETFSPALKAYAKSLSFAEAAKAQGMTRFALAKLRAQDIDLDSAFREVEDRALDKIEGSVLKRAVTEPADARFVLRSKRPKEWGGTSKGAGGPVQVQINVNLFDDDDDAHE